jgi:hypothetical protein
LVFADLSSKSLMARGKECSKLLGRVKAAVGQAGTDQGIHWADTMWTASIAPELRPRFESKKKIYSERKNLSSL